MKHSREVYIHNEKEMTKKQVFPILIAVAMVAGGISSCDNGCEQIRENFLHASFVSATGRVMTNMEIILSNGEDGYLLTGIKQFDDVELDLNPNDSLTYLLVNGTYNDYGDSFSLTDTIYLAYKAEPYYLDMNCGCTVIFELQSVTSTHHLFTSIEVVDPIVLTDSGINLKFEY